MTEVRHGFEVKAADRQWSDPSQSKPVPLARDGGRHDEDSPTSQFASSDSKSMHPGDPLLDAGATDVEASQKILDMLPTLSENRADNENLLQEDGEGVIYHLIVAVKSPHTVNAIRPYAKRLRPESTILFLQNGMGMIDEVNRELFPEQNGRPHYMVGVCSHGLYAKGSYDIIHAGDGTIALGLLAEKKRYPPSARYLIRMMTRTPVFVAVGFERTELLQQQLDKLAVNAVINPLTAILDCLNGEILDNFFITRVIRLLLAEISVVIRSLIELKDVPNVDVRFNTARLESMVFGIAESTGRNRSSMLQDVRGGRETEIDYINGYIVKRGEELGIHCVTNYMIMQMVKAKGKMNELDLGGIVPLRPSFQ